MNRITKILMAFGLAIACSPVCREPEPPPAPTSEWSPPEPSHTSDLIGVYGGEGGKRSSSSSAGEGGAAPAPVARFGAVPGACAGWRASPCVKSPTSSRYYIAVPDGKRFAEFLSEIPSPGFPVPAICIVAGERSCGGYPYDVCNDGNTDYFYCGNTRRHDAEGYWR
jgi:hypothetical protein